jgi:hypothetical protein
MKYSANLRTTTATAALVLALGAPAVFAQATADTALRVESILTSSTYAAGNYQVLSATPSAVTTNNNINLSLIVGAPGVGDAIDDIVTVAAPQTNGLISATAIGNSSTALGQLLYSPTTAGETAAVGTLQAVQADVLAATTGDTHSIVIENAGAGVRTLTGTTLSDNNDITASATGNTATSAITAASGLDLVQAAGVQATFNIDGTLAAAIDNDVSGDLIVSSSQEIDAIEAGGPLTVFGLVGGAETSTFIEGLDDATVTLSNNDQASSATGNSAASSISSLDTTASITASTAVSNLQVISAGAFAVGIDATTASSAIVVSSGIDSNGTDTGDVADSTISVRDNTQSATARGSVSTQSIALDASSITGEGLAANTGEAKAALEAAGDSIIGNVQAIETGVEVFGGVGGNLITSIIALDSNNNDVTKSTIELTGNTQAATATGVSTSNTLSLTSGATMNAAGVVASVQAVGGAVTALTDANAIRNINNVDNVLDDSTLRTVDNTVSSTATGARAVNLLESTTGTNNLDVAANAGVVNNSINNPTTMPRVTAGQALLNDQSMATSAVVSSTTSDNQVLTETGQDVSSSTVATDGNVMSASATASEASNSVSLAFNELVGGISGAGTGVVAAVGNEQTLENDMIVTARTIGANGEPIRTYTASDAVASNVSTSDNIVSAAANGNVTFANNVIVDATNVTSGSLAAPVMAAGGDSTATGSFVAASTQISGADILASQLDLTGTGSNTIMTEFGDDIEASSTVLSDDNVLSAVATANSANNAVQLGDDQSATVAASGVVANYQGTLAAGSVTSQIGIEGTDSLAAFTSTNSGNSALGQLVLNVNDLVNNGGTALVLTFASPLTSEEVAILISAGYTNATVGGTTAEIAGGGASADTTIFNATFNNGGDGVNNGNESLTITGFSSSAVAGDFSGAGVIVKVDGANGGEILASTVSVSGNTVVGEVTGNTANNAVSATATSVTGLAATAVSVDVGVTALVNPTGADLVTANLQASEAPLTSDVYAVFGIIADDAENGDMDEILNSTQMVSDNLQQSYATANRATNSVDVTATNASAETALDSVQASVASVETDSGMQVVANAGSTTSSLEMDGNTNQSVANGNVVNNVTTADVTNANAVDGAVNASANLTAGLVVAANNVVASAQIATADVTATATTDVFNQDNSTPTVEEIVGSDVSMSSNSTIAQATANSAASGNILALGNDGTANMNQTGLVANLQQTLNGAATVLASVDQDISLALTGDGNGFPVNTSSLSLDGNSSTALARSNVATNALIVDGANINAGDGADAVFDEGDSLVASYVLGSLQGNAADVTATTTQSRVVVDMSNDGGSGGVVLGSTVSLSGNASSATALANTATNSVSVGANAANVDASTALGNTQFNGGGVTATGGSEVGVEVFAGTAGGQPVGIGGSTVMVSENFSSSNASGNQAQNTLTVAGANIVSGAATSASIDSSGAADDNQASAGNLLLNSQENEGLITSTNTANFVGIRVDVAEGTVTPGSAVSGSTLGVTGNVTEARATANLVLNSSISIGGAGTSSLDSTAAIGNFQVNDSAGTVEASASTSTGISLIAAGDATGLNAGTAMVQGNSTLALARGNVAENILDADGSNVTSGTNPATLNSGTNPAFGVLNASFGVLNEQQQRASVTAESLNASYRVDVTAGPRTSGALGLALNAASATVSGNSVNASAFGNVATNRVNLASLTGAGNDASVAVYNAQLNTGAITSTASGATIGVFSVGGVVSAAVGVSNNSISATSIGNFATSSFTRSDR